MSELKTKHCLGCGQDLPATLGYFYADKTRSDGLSRLCKKDDEKRRKKRDGKAATAILKNQQKHKKKLHDQLAEAIAKTGAMLGSPGMGELNREVNRQFGGPAGLVALIKTEMLEAPESKIRLEYMKLAVSIVRDTTKLNLHDLDINSLNQAQLELLEMDLKNQLMDQLEARRRVIEASAVPVPEPIREVPNERES